tara:strand:+ start:1699 stop:1872 length:174 start_codon:yes stop_codon:yes gene_type:complete
LEKMMSESKKETKKVVKKEAKKSQLKITKPNGNVILRDNMEGLVKAYEAKGWKVEEV